MSGVEGPGAIRQFVHAGAAAIVTGFVGGDLTVLSGSTTHAFDPFPPAAGPLSPAPAPAGLLVAQQRIVDFTGRDAELDALGSWRDGTEHLAARLLYARGGQGKTRLAAELCTRSTGWT